MLMLVDWIRLTKSMRNGVRSRRQTMRPTRAKKYLRIRSHGASRCYRIGRLHRVTARNDCRSLASCAPQVKRDCATGSGFPGLHFKPVGTCLSFNRLVAPELFGKEIAIKVVIILDVGRIAMAILLILELLK